jgi:FKBP-type peptidyl-prolyl cis-trans isomerase FkpA/FKBP-type peptidyl-prolyl cis-trans isomerase FklB
LLGGCVLALPAFAADIKLETDDQKAAYALGLLISDNLQSYNLSEAELEVFKAGVTDGVLKRKPQLDLNATRPLVQKLAQSRHAAMLEAEKKEAAAFLEKAAQEKGAVKTESGLIYVEMKPGSGPSPAATDTVKVHYHGTLRDGTVFDSSVQRGEPATFALNRVVKCWTEGVQKIKVGGKSKLICPAAIAYGDRGSPPKIKPGAALIFEVELLEIVSKEGPAPKAQ